MTETPLDARFIGETCACYHVRHAARVITRAYDEALKPAGLRGPQFSILTALRVAKDVSISRLAEHMGMDRTTMSRNLRPLERQGLVTVSPEGRGPTRTIALTEAGSARLDQAIPLWKRVQEKAMRALGGDDWPLVRDRLHRLETAF